MAGRNANGEGTIYKRRDGRYEGAVYLTTVSGITKRVRVYGKTRIEAYKKLTETKSQTQKGAPIPDRTWRLNEYLDHWLQDVVKISRRPATYAQCEMIARLYLKPGIGKFGLKQLSVPAVQGFLNEILADGQSIPKAQVIRKVLSSALTSAQREELVSRNVARLVVLPTYEREEITPWTAEEAKRFLAVSQADPLYPAFVLLLHYGLRRGEVLGLRWCDIDFANNVLHVRHQLQRVGHSLELGSVKTKAGRRPLPLLESVRQVLLSHKERQEQLRRAADEAWHGSSCQESLIFTNQDGRPLEASVLVRSFQRICKQHGIRLIRVHDLRHGFATLLKDLGTPVRDAQLLLGHARVTTTQEIYQHDNMDQRRSTLERVAAELVYAHIKSDTPMYRRHSSGRSRQFSRQIMDFVVAGTSVVSGAGGGTLTPGLILGKSSDPCSSNRLASVKQAAQRRATTWILGCVAVEIAVSNDSPPSGDWRSVSLPPRKEWTS